jgi:NAD(P)-dependent dehydrogenase (short-subunit alcohol dehydrogenase family)
MRLHVGLLIGNASLRKITEQFFQDPPGVNISSAISGGLHPLRRAEVRCGLYVDDADATVAAVRAAGGTMVSMQPCELSKPADCQALVDFAVRTFGRIDVLFNNAAMAYFNWLEDISDEEWDRNRRSEVDLVFYLTRAA